MRPALRLLAALAGLGGVVALGTALPEQAVVRAPAAEQTDVVGAGLVCTDLRQAEGQVRTAVAVGLADAATAGSTALTVRRLGGEPPPDPTAPPSRPRVPQDGVALPDLGLSATEAALDVRSTGPGAAGLAAQQTLLVTAGAVRGLASAPCAPARTDGWLLGGGTTVGESSTLLLVNPDPEPAVVDVTVLTGEAPADERPGRGLTVPAGGRLSLALDTLAPDRSRFAVRVRASQGRVAAGMRHERSDGVVPRGVAYAADALAPAREVVVPGLPAGPGGRAVQVSNPGPVDTDVSVEVTTADGQFVPDGLGGVLVPAGSTVSVDLSGPLGASPAAVRVRSLGEPVLAVGVTEDAGLGDVRDLAYTGPADALSGAVLLPDVELGERETTVLLSALAGDAVAQVSVLQVAGAPPLTAPPVRVDVPGGRVVAVPVSSLLPLGAVGRVAVQVAPDPAGGPLSAAATVAAASPDGPLRAGWALVSRPDRVPRPQVVRDPVVGTG